mmetsp:Transcript_41415/g.110415  ORF Transcript_41415/g.110415 Transcript_41415/m.110415 type:complete len:282 (-) Transcript_41415:40-885(-)
MRTSNMWSPFTVRSAKAQPRNGALAENLTPPLGRVPNSSRILVPLLFPGMNEWITSCNASMPKPLLAEPATKGMSLPAATARCKVASSIPASRHRPSLRERRPSLQAARTVGGAEAHARSRLEALALAHGHAPQAALFSDCHNLPNSLLLDLLPLRKDLPVPQANLLLHCPMPLDRIRLSELLLNHVQLSAVSVDVHSAPRFVDKSCGLQTLLDGRVHPQLPEVHVVHRVILGHRRRAGGDAETRLPGLVALVLGLGPEPRSDPSHRCNSSFKAAAAGRPD